MTDHAGGGVHDAHVLEDGGTVVGDDDLSLRSLDHLVHATGTERCPDSVGDGCEPDEEGGMSWSARMPR